MQHLHWFRPVHMKNLIQTPAKSNRSELKRWLQYFLNRSIHVFQNNGYFSVRRLPVNNKYQSANKFPHVVLRRLSCDCNFMASRCIGDYLIERLHELGVRHVFGIPGDYVLAFYDALQKSSLKLVNTCDEQGAGFAADAYARVHGLGVVCVTYCVGG